MKKLLLSISALVLSCIQLNAQLPSQIFSNNYTATSNANDFGSSVLDLENGEVAVAGTTGNLNPTFFNAKPCLYNNNFIGKFNEVGANVWQATIGVATVAQLAKDANGNIFAVGYVQGTSATFNATTYGSVGTNTLGSQNVFVVKYSPAGVLQWVKVVGSAGDEFGTGIAVDPSGDVYVTGYATSGFTVMDFEPGVAAAAFSSNYKSFLVKLSNNGNYIWHKTTPNGGTNYHSVCADANNVYWATQVSGTQNVNPTGPTWNAYSAGGYDILLMKYRKDGTLQNVKTIGGSASTDYARGIEVKDGNIVLFGALAKGTLPSINMNGYAEVPVVALSTNGTTNKDGFVALYDTMMVCQWAKPIGGTTATDEVWGGAFDNTGHVLVSGQFSGANTNFNIGGAFNIPASSNGASTDCFYSSYIIATGECNGVYRQGGTGSDQAADIAVDIDGRIWATGYINNGSTGNDMFLNKHFCASTYTVSVDRNGYISPMSTSSWGNAFGFIGCETQQAVYTATAITNTNAKYSFYDLNGAQSNGNVFIEPVTTATMATKGYRLLVKDSVTKCEQVFIIQYSQVNSLNPPFSVYGPFGLASQCPGSSILLQGNLSSTEGYTWTPGSIVIPSPNATIYVSPTVTTTYTATVYDGIANNAGCYWSASATVTVAPSNTITGVVSTTLLCSGSQLGFSVNGTANSYTWTSGNNGVLSISPDFSITPTTSDTYTLFTTTGSCSNTYTVSVTVTTCTGLQDINNESGISIYPNPTNGSLFIDITTLSDNSSIQLFDMTGRIVLNQTITSAKEQLDISHLNKGIYFLGIKNNGQSSIRKIIKE